MSSIVKNLKTTLLIFTVTAIVTPSTTFANRIFRGPASATANEVISDEVVKVRQDDEGINILFKKTAGSYYLRNSQKGFDSTRKKLEQSLAKKKPVQVTVEPLELNILEVK